MSDASDGDDNNHPPSNRQMFAGIKQTDMNASSANMQSKVDSFVVDINTNTLLLSASSTDSSVSHSTNNIKTFSINPISISSSSSLISNNESVQSKNSLLTVESGSRGSLLNGASVRPGSAPPRSQSIAKPPPPPRGSSLRNDVSKDKKPSDFVLRNLMNPIGQEEEITADNQTVQQLRGQPQAESSTDDELQVGFYTDLKRRITLGRNWKQTHKQAVRRRRSTSAYLHAVDTLNSFSQPKSSKQDSADGTTEAAAAAVPLAIDPTSPTTDTQPGFIAPEKRQKYVQVRQYIVGEILQTEQNYVTGLDVVLQRFRGPLLRAATGGNSSAAADGKQNNNHSPLAIGQQDSSINPTNSSSTKSSIIIPIVDIKIIFAFIEDLHEFNKIFLRELEAVVKNWDLSERIWTAKDTGYSAAPGESTKSIGTLFTNYETGWKVYLKYVDNYSAAKEAIRRSEENSPAYRQFILDCLKSKDCQRQGISDFLILPIQRVTRYVLLLQDLKKHTPGDHPEYASIGKALEFMRTLAGTVNDVKRREEEMTRMFHVVRTVEDCPPTLISAHRRILCEADTLDVTRDFYHLAFVPLALANAGISILPSAVASPGTVQLDHGTYFRVFIFTDVLMMTKLKNRKRKDKRLASLTGGSNSSLGSDSGSTKKEKMTLFRMAWLKNIEVLDVTNSDIAVYYKTNVPRMLIKLVIHNSDAGDPIAKRRFWAQLAEAKADGFTRRASRKTSDGAITSVNSFNPGDKESSDKLSTISEQQQPSTINVPSSANQKIESIERLALERISLASEGSLADSPTNGMTRRLQTQTRRITIGSSSPLSEARPPLDVDNSTIVTAQQTPTTRSNSSGGGAPQRSSSLIANDPSITSLYEQMKFDPIAPGSSDVGVLVTAPSALPAKPTSFLHQQPSYLQSPDLSPMKSNSAPGVDSPLATVVSTDHSVAMNNQQTMRPLQLAPAVVTSTPTTTITETFILEFDDAKQKGEFLLIVGKLLASFKSHTNISNAS